MIIKVNPHTIELINQDLVNEKELNVNDCVFLFDDKIDDRFIKNAYFTLKDKTYKQVIVDNRCDIPSEVLKEKGTIEIGVVAFYIDEQDKEIRYNPSPIYVNSIDGSLKDNSENSRPITPSEFEQYQQALQNGLNKVDDELENAKKNGEYAKKQGDYAKSVGVQLEKDKESGLFKGEKGDDYVISNSDYEEIAEIIQNNIETLTNLEIEKLLGGN